ncbi:Flp family type IVb pilin [Methylobacterium durans]|uniref:Flp family type IVb pilin n=1 Tax=Methylobacterium durans TaxID=2202825 RepID=UPI002AFF7568|nr:Flp family type IVb pilin [Methylobacterium durans]MEA1831638.1 Flp family type IVb pilin [Methylobacterium durans]
MAKPAAQEGCPVIPGRISRLWGLINRLGQDRRGATAIEYAMIGGLIFAVSAGAIRLYGAKLNTVYDKIGTTIGSNLN